MNQPRGALRGAPRRHTLISRKPPSSPTVVAMPKTEMSRFPIHDDLTAPDESLPILKGASSAAGQLPNFLGVLAGGPAALKAYVRFRAELRHGALPRHSAERIGLAVAVADEPPARRTVVIKGHPERLPAARPPRPPRTALERVGASPDRIVAYAVALGFLLVLIAVLTTGQ